MRDLLGALLMAGILIAVFVIAVRYGYLAWFQPEEFRRVVRDDWPAWQKKVFSAAGILKWMDSPGYILAARLTSLAAFLFCVLLWILAARPIAVALTHAFR